jgi:hypothetical protein
MRGFASGRAQRNSAAAGRLQDRDRVGQGVIERRRQPFIEIHHGRQLELVVRHALVAVR